MDSPPLHSAVQIITNNIRNFSCHFTPYGWICFLNITQILVEPKASGKSLVQLLRRETNFNVSELKTNFVRYSKIERARASSPFIEGGRVYLIQDNWNDAFIQQVSTFPNAKHDEHIDVTSYSIERNLINNFFIV